MSQRGKQEKYFDIGAFSDGKFATMSCDLPCVSYMALYIISMHIINTNSRTSTHWKLNMESGKVQAAMAAAGGADTDTDSGSEDPLMSILTSRTNLDNGEWRLDASPSCAKNNCLPNKKEAEQNETSIVRDNDTTNRSNAVKDTSTKEKKTGQYTEHRPKKNATDSHSGHKSETSPRKKHILDCGKPVNFTQFDSLRGIADRASHPSIPEPEVAMIFKKKSSKPGTQEVDMNELEKKLRKERKEKPKSPQVYNQIGNFWRIRGNTQMSIECFRKALFLSPNNSDVLLNMARVLFNLQYLDDAIELTRQSLANQSPRQNSWLQHFTLGEILKAYGRYAEATENFQLALELNPGFQPAEAHLRDMEINPNGTVTYYTLFIILFLVLGVLCGILTSVDGNLEDLGESMKTQRHFNRAMAMRSIKLGINPRVIRMRKQGYNG